MGNAGRMETEGPNRYFKDLGRSITYVTVNSKSYLSAKNVYEGLARNKEIRMCETFIKREQAQDYVIKRKKKKDWEVMAG